MKGLYVATAILAVAVILVGSAYKTNPLHFSLECVAPVKNNGGT